MYYKVIKELPKKKSWSPIAREALKFWEDDNARYALVDSSKYSGSSSCLSSWSNAAKSVNVPVSVRCIDGQVYLIKNIDLQEDKNNDN